MEHGLRWLGGRLVGPVGLNLHVQVHDGGSRNRRDVAPINRDHTFIGPGRAGLRIYWWAVAGGHRTRSERASRVSGVACRILTLKKNA